MVFKLAMDSSLHAGVVCIIIDYPIPTYNDVVKQFTKFVLFLFQFITIGLAAAFVILILKPELLNNVRPKVEIRQHAPTAAEHAVTHTNYTAPFSYATAVQQAAPSVVNIYTSKVVARKPSTEDLLRHYFNGTTPESSAVETSLGSGVIMTAQGHIITNNHVISGATEIQVLLNDGRNASAKIVGTDPETDLAILQTDMDNLPVITVGGSDKIQVGDVVLAIGNPYGVGQTVTQGIISATERKRLGLNTFENFIQTDAAINPGNSGGALINPRGDLIGINSAIFSKSGGSQGIGFAIPVNLARKVMTEIIEKGHVVRGWLGVRLRDLPEDIARGLKLPIPGGVIITGLFEDGPALNSGLQAGDILLMINKQPIYDVRNLLDAVAKQKPGSIIQLDGQRDNRKFTAEIEVTQRPVMTYRNLRR
jgi:serine protease DegS